MTKFGMANEIIMFVFEFCINFMQFLRVSTTGTAIYQVVNCPLKSGNPSDKE